MDGGSKHYDIIIVGAGPAGCICAYQLKDQGLNIALIDKARYPRDKICGDAISIDVINQLDRIDKELLQRFYQFEQKRPVSGLRFVAPNCNAIDIKLPKKEKGSVAFVSKRIDFDNFLLQQIQNTSIDIFEDQRVQEVSNHEDHIILSTQSDHFTCTMLVGADGANSIIRRKLTDYQVNPEHHMGGVRQYFKGVSGLGDQIELHFYSEVLPGYFWIFPVNDDIVNVGLGVLTKKISAERIDLKLLLNKMIAEHPNLNGRFVNATSLGRIEGFGLPGGRKNAQRSGDNFLLVGDAASLIDPFTGEGIGNAIRSGRLAADHLIKAFEQNQFKGDFNMAYDQSIITKMGAEFQVSRMAQKLFSKTFFFNYVVNRVRKRPNIQEMLNKTLTSNDMFQRLSKPSFYLKLLFG